MNTYVARLIDCGVPRLTAVYLCMHYMRRGLRELERYVESVEAETRVYVEDV